MVGNGTENQNYQVNNNNDYDNLDGRITNIYSHSSFEVIKCNTGQRQEGVSCILDELTESIHIDLISNNSTKNLFYKNNN